MTEQLKEGLAQLGLTPPEGAVAQMAQYAGLLLEQNKVMNLTAIKEPAQVAALHFLDSAALLGCADLRGKSLVDVGTGAGFPGMVLKLMVPELRLTLVDSLGKRLDWLGEVCGALGLEGVERRHARAEELALQSGWRDSFDFATARAVAELRVLCEICLPYVKVGGRFLAMKAADCDEELSAAAHGAELLGGAASPLLSVPYPRHRGRPKGYRRGEGRPHAQGLSQTLGQDPEIASLLTTVRPPEHRRRAREEISHFA